MTPCVDPWESLRMRFLTDERHVVTQPRNVAECRSHPLGDGVRGDHCREIDSELDTAVRGVHTLAARAGAAGKAPCHGARGDGDPSGRNDVVAGHAHSVACRASLVRAPVAPGGPDLDRLPGPLRGAHGLTRIRIEEVEARRVDA